MLDLPPGAICAKRMQSRLTNTCPIPGCLAFHKRGDCGIQAATSLSLTHPPVGSAHIRALNCRERTSALQPRRTSKSHGVRSFNEPTPRWERFVSYSVMESEIDRKAARVMWVWECVRGGGLVNFAMRFSFISQCDYCRGEGSG